MDDYSRVRADQHLQVMIYRRATTTYPVCLTFAQDHTVGQIRLHDLPQILSEIPAWISLPRMHLIQTVMYSPLI